MSWVRRPCATRSCIILWCGKYGLIFWWVLPTLVYPTCLHAMLAQRAARPPTHRETEKKKKKPATPSPAPVALGRRFAATTRRRQCSDAAIAATGRGPAAGAGGALTPARVACAPAVAWRGAAGCGARDRRGRRAGSQKWPRRRVGQPTPRDTTRRHRGAPPRHRPPCGRTRGRAPVAPSSLLPATRRRHRHGRPVPPRS